MASRPMATALRHSGLEELWICDGVPVFDVTSNVRVSSWMNALSCDGDMM